MDSLGTMIDGEFARWRASVNENGAPLTQNFGGLLLEETHTDPVTNTDDSGNQRPRLRPAPTAKTKRKQLASATLATTQPPAVTASPFPMGQSNLWITELSFGLFQTVEFLFSGFCRVLGFVEFGAGEAVLAVWQSVGLEFFCERYGDQSCQRAFAILCSAWWD